jgi:predicted short-subunit dehydrogenase-like oxidoreductase (DUF2520 family)
MLIFCPLVNTPTIAVVGPGRLGTALTLSLHAARCEIRQIVSGPSEKSLRHARQLSKRVGAKVGLLSNFEIDAKITWLCVPDRAIRPVANELAAKNSWRGRIVFHASGALGSDELSALRQRGASVAAVHPLMTFIADTHTTLGGVPFAMEGDPKAVRAARAIVRALGGESFLIAANRKAAYHAFGAFVSPLIVALLRTAEEVGVAAGLDSASARRKLAPIVHQTLRNYLAAGPDRAFTGPLVRGDVATVESHLRAMQKLPHAAAVYAALARAALRRLPVNRKQELKKVLDRKK